MKKIYHLSTCNTCQRIISEINPGADVVLQDIKTEAITEKQLEEMYKLSGSYESLFSKRAQLYRQRGLNTQSLNENDFKELILEHYTFLKRPVIIIDDQIFIGNSKKNIASAADALLK
ncbi:arsenate reductase family protein [Dokdonia sp. Hel_I_53]|uniref:arsenate reductase family protein n=1 Tax=Dokdonia sp. Hel_I_53 TaxID=1566287 RepID=UPI0011995934|nr:ArsC/Spx/MgsR family protein [Dokdonia sp. Hel_I_53]TVZ52778.1 arsenate reductase-like glutaredoxin family protein [Dokdonia sp. Hel_I_53]